MQLCSELVVQTTEEMSAFMFSYRVNKELQTTLLVRDYLMSPHAATSAADFISCCNAVPVSYFK